MWMFYVYLIFEYSCMWMFSAYGSGRRSVKTSRPFSTHPHLNHRASWSETRPLLLNGSLIGGMALSTFVHHFKKAVLLKYRLVFLWR